MKDNQAKYPQLRFKGFTNPWEQRKTKELCDISTGKGNTQDKVKDGKYPFYVRSATIERSNEYLYDQEAVLTVGDGVGTGKVFHYVNGKYNLHQRVYRMFNFNHGVSAKYFYHYFSKNFYRRVMSMTAKTSVDSVRMEMIADMKIKFPSPAEQETIVAVLDGVDDLISLHQRKLAKLKELKQGYLQKLFPKNGSKFPQLRFSGFADAWEQRKLSDLTESHNSGVYIPKDQYGEGTNIIGVGDIYDSDVVDGQRYRLAPVKDKRFILHTNDLLYGESSLVPEGIARVVSVSEAGAGTAFAWHTRRFKVNQVTLNSRFLGLELDYWLPARSHLMRSSTKTALTGITTQDFFNTQIVFPSKPEQEKIATLINSLDTAIALHQRKLEKLQELKKGYLQKMFC
ncbi:restriction endonuclease subunit S [Lactiplantibacillus plantarum]|nr:restriction endonuclease subunit S [Lactiplantibacillus plantarum]MCG0954850.1 restriction endonuclease subunit S [Lactiplantibacillus plantarum]